MTKTFCDRCGRESEKPHKVEVDMYRIGVGEIVVKDVCKACYHALKEFLAQQDKPEK